MKIGLKEKYIKMILDHPYYNGDETTGFKFECRSEHISTYETKFRDYINSLDITFELNVIFTDDSETQFRTETLPDLLDKEIAYLSVRIFTHDDGEKISMPEELLTYKPMIGVKPELN